MGLLTTLWLVSTGAPGVCGALVEASIMRLPACLHLSDPKGRTAPVVPMLLAGHKDISVQA